jgi:hypothetical protein
MLPFAIPICLTLVLALSVGEDWPRNIAPGSGLKLAGLLATAVTALAAWFIAIRHIADRRAHQMAALVCGISGLMGWPVWSVGIMPSVNGMSLGPEQSVRMILERTEDTRVSRSRRRNHWAWLQPASPGGEAGAGRYFIPEATYMRWNETRPATVTVTVAQGLLGAQVATRFE